MPNSSNRRRLLVAAPSGRDAPLAKQILERAGFDVLICEDVTTMYAEARIAVGACVIAEEALDADAVAWLTKLAHEQPSWSDVPLVVIANRSAQRRSNHLDTLVTAANVTVLERPLRTSSFASALRSALRARDRQYDSEQAIVQRDAFLAMLSHELRNPLAAVILASDLLGGATLDAADHQRQVDLITRQARHLTRLVDDLLEVSRVTTGKISLQRQPLDLDGLLKGVLMTLGARWDRDRIDIVHSRVPVTVHGDGARIEQVLINLLTNALKYTPAPGRVQVTIERQGTEGRIVVRDQGIGVTHEMLPRIFDMFVKADGALARSQGGMGVGLTLVKSLVELHGGRVEAHSEGLGRGSEFIVHLPLFTESDVDSRQAALEPDASAPRRRVAIIEDSDDLRDTMDLILRRAGHATSVACDGTHGIALLLTEHPDVAFIDLGLPGIDGYEVARRARKHFGHAIQLIALSGYGQVEDKARALEAGFNSHLTKPIDSAMLLRTALAS